MDNAKTHAEFLMTLVETMHNVNPSATDQFANVLLAGLVTLMLNVSNVSFPLFAELKHNFHCFHITDECQVNDDCPLDKACVNNECVDPCARTSCGDRALCEVDYHQSHCVCPPGLQGNPIVQCSAVECTSDNDCATTEKCDLSVQQCYDICQREPCGAAEAVCESRNHRKTCSCPPPLLGDGNVYCGLKRKHELSDSHKIEGYLIWYGF